MTDVLPSVSTIGRRRTSALRLTIRRTPIASEIVTTAGSASGTTATASAMPNMNISSAGRPRSEADDHDERDHDERGLRERRAQSIEVLLQRGPTGLDRLHHLSDAAELGGHPGGDDDRVAAAVDDERPGVGHVLAIAERQARIVEAGDGLLNGGRLPGERRLVNREVDGVGDAGVSGDSVTGAQQHDVSRHEIAGRDGRFLTIAQHVRRRGGHSAQRFQRPAGAVFLDESEQHREQHDDGDDDGLERVTEEAGDDRGAEQNQNQRVLELREEGVPRRLRGQRLQLVGAMHGEPMRGLGGSSSPVEGRRELRERRVDRQRVPRGSPLRALLDAVLRGHTDPPGPRSSAEQIDDS